MGTLADIGGRWLRRWSSDLEKPRLLDAGQEKLGALERRSLWLFSFRTVWKFSVLV